ncbi:MAG: hypothetical protein JF610_15450, partial [Acidobacteria bacterium]|nr:hypothetical protein [Acidobacteriota bacterium]
MRFDSWKAIAGYLGKDESTVRRWERELGLPVHRVQGAPGRSVFAFKEELDAWMTARREDAANAPPRVEQSEAERVEPPRAPSAVRPVVATLATAVVLLVIASAWSHGLSSKVVAASLNDKVRGGSLVETSPSGAVARQFSFDDIIRFGGGTYGPPWILSDFRVSPPGAPRRIALVAHHYEWWPSVLTILDETAPGAWQRRATFVNAGWIEHLYWLSPSRLLISGYNEALDGGVVALLDADAIGGQLRAPEQDSKFDCLGCAPAKPISYFVLPRTEVNLVTGSRFNRASVDVQDGGFVVRTIEVEQDGPVAAADALYDFSPDWTLRGVSFSSRYW